MGDRAACPASSIMSSWTSVAVWSISTTAPSFIRLLLVDPSAFAESSRSSGRMRLPPPAIRYSAISVMTATSEADWLENSCSIAARSSRSRSKTSFAVAMESVLTLLESIRATGAVLSNGFRNRHVKIQSWFGNVTKILPICGNLPLDRSTISFCSEGAIRAVQKVRCIALQSSRACSRCESSMQH